jgi:hypothetical protein
LERLGFRLAKYWPLTPSISALVAR